VGIFVASFVAVRLGLGRLPDRTNWPMLFGLGAVGGIGFTVSIFIAGLSFPGADVLTEEAKIAILLASLVAAVVGVVLLLAATRAPREQATDI
jgi:NhaA family Na+:H+ antiporter